MGSNPTQAYGLIAFLTGFTMMAGGFAAGGSILLILLGIALLAFASFLFLRCKPWEHVE